MIQKLVASYKRKKTRRETVKVILSQEQCNKGVVNIHRLDLKNIGDYYCAPHHYFDALKGKTLDIFDNKSQDKTIIKNFTDTISANSLIIGGGGLLNRNGFAQQMKLFETLAEGKKKTVLWGVGHNEKSPVTYGKVTDYNVDITKFGLAGTRDLSMPGEFLPCVSCLHTVFDKTFTESQEIGLIFHKDTMRKPKILNMFKDYPSTSNTTNLEDLIDFIGKSQTIITDSYHAMYWTMLLGKKVVVVPNSSKFYDFNHKPVFSSFEDAIAAIVKATPYSGVLEECRAINHVFYEKTANYLNL